MTDEQEQAELARYWDIYARLLREQTCLLDNPSDAPPPPEGPSVTLAVWKRS